MLNRLPWLIANLEARRVEKRRRVLIAAAVLPFCILFFLTNICGLLELKLFSDKTLLSGRPAVPVLMYHHILKKADISDKHNQSILSMESFEEQMKYLYDNHYKTITLKELETYLSSPVELPEKSLLITFDDCYASTYVYAYPILKKYGFKAAVFVITGFVKEKAKPFDPKRLSYMSMEEMERSTDVFEFASHTDSLHQLNRLHISTLLLSSSKNIQRDLTHSMELLNTRCFAYPYGQYDLRLICRLRSLGFKMAFSSVPGKIKPGQNMYTLRRYAILPRTSLKDFIRILK